MQTFDQPFIKSAQIVMAHAIHRRGRGSIQEIEAAAVLTGAAAA